jgi:SAM-dependent methyltransferase
MAMAIDNRAGSGLLAPNAVATDTGFDPRYLAVKKSIDDRALNRYVWAALRQALPQTTGAAPANILEIGAGIGTMLARLVDWGLLTGPATYLATDCDAGQIRFAQNYLSTWAEQRGHALFWTGDQRGRLRTATNEISLVFETVRAEALASRTNTLGTFHLLIAHAVLDLIDLSATLPGLLAHLTQNGLAYCTCNFDGSTLFFPEYHGTDETEFLKRYHASMEARLTGASHTGRRLLTFLQRPGMELLAAGSSDWVIHPSNNGYSEDETFFLHSLIATVERELAGETGPAPSGLATWARTRHQQVEAGTVSFLARNLDFLARRQPSLP